MTELEKRTAAEQRRKFQERRAELYRDHPEAERFMKKKSRLLKFFLLYCLGITLGKAVLLGVVNGVSLGTLVIALVVTFGMSAIFLAAGLGFKWKLAFLLYVWALHSLFRLFGSAREVIGSLPDMVKAHGALYAVPAAVDLLNVVFFILVLAAAAWLTLPPENRRLAEEAEALEEQWKAYIAAQTVEKSK